MKKNLAIFRINKEQFGNLSEELRKIWQFIGGSKKYLAIYRRE